MTTPDAPFVRRAIEKLSRGVVLRRRLPSNLGGGTLFVAPEAGGLRLWRPGLGKTDPNLCRSVLELVKPGQCVWDIGANVGMFAFAAAFLAGSAGLVLAVEPDADNLRLLHRSRQSMQSDRNATVHILGAAVSRPGQRIATFNIAVRSRSTNYLEGFGATQTGGVREVRKVPVFTLDELLEHFPAPDVLKIDVEGAELSVIEGATRTLSRVRPNILLEVDPPNVEEAGRILRGYGYRLMNADLPPDARTETVNASWNCLCQPT